MPECLSDLYSNSKDFELLPLFILILKQKTSIRNLSLEIQQLTESDNYQPQDNINNSDRRSLYIYTHTYRVVGMHAYVQRHKISKMNVMKINKQMEERVELQRLILSLILGDHIHCQKILCFDFFLFFFFHVEMLRSFILQNICHATKAFLSNQTLHRIN